MIGKLSARTIAVLLPVLIATHAQAESPAEFENGKVSFSVTVRGQNVNYRELAVAVLPKAALPVAVPAKAAANAFVVEASAGSLRESGPGAWQWTAPSEVGLYPLVIRSTETGESVRLNMFVMVPRERVTDGSLNGYRIGSYPATPMKGLEIYKPPPGFIEVTEANLDTPVSRRFTLRQFLCKQDGGYPK